MLETGTFLEVTDGEFDNGVTKVVDVEGNAVTDEVVWRRGRGSRGKVWVGSR